MQQVLNNRNLQLTFVGVVLFIFFLGNNQLSLWDNSESMTALAAQQIIETGKWRLLFFNTFDGIQQHQLQVWETALCYKMFGINEFATRLPSVLYVILTVITLFYFAKKLYTEQIAILSVVMLTSSFFVPTLGKINLAESGLMFYATVLFFSFLSMLKSNDWKITTAFWLAAFLSTFQGDLIGIASITGVLVILFLLKKDRRKKIIQSKLYLLPLVSLPLLVLAFASSAVKITPNEQLFYNTFLKHTNSIFVGRQTILLILGFLPWIAFLPASLVRLVKDFIKKEEAAIIYGSWLIFGYLLYEIVPTSLLVPSAIIYPAIAILMAKKFIAYDAACQRFENSPINEHIEIRAKKAKFQEENLIKTSQLLGVIIVFCITFVLAMIGYSQGIGIMKTGFVGMILWVTGFITAIGLYARTSRTVFYSSMIGGLLFMLFGWLLVVPVLEPARSISKRAVEVITKSTHKDSIIVAVSDEYILSSLPFYLKKEHLKPIFISDKEMIKVKYLNTKNCIFILDDYQYKALKTIMNETSHKAFQIEPIEGILTPIFKSGNYWVVQR